MKRLNKAVSVTLAMVLLFSAVVTALISLKPMKSEAAGALTIIDFEDLRPLIDAYCSNSTPPGEKALPRLNYLVPPDNNGVGYMGITWADNIILSINDIETMNQGNNGSAFNYYKQGGTHVYGLLSDHGDNGGQYGGNHGSDFIAVMTFPAGVKVLSADIAGKDTSDTVRSSTYGNNDINFSVGTGIKTVDTSAWIGDVGTFEIKKQWGYYAIAYTNIIVEGLGQGGASKVITLDLNYQGAPTPATVQTFTKLSSAQMASPVMNPTRQGGYMFTGWYTVSGDSGGTKIDANYSFTNNTTIYARWYAPPSGQFIIDFEDLRLLIDAYCSSNYGLPSINTLVPPDNNGVGYKGIIWDDYVTVSVNDLENLQFPAGGQNEAMNYYKQGGTHVFAFMSDHGANGGTYGGWHGQEFIAKLTFPAGFKVLGLDLAAGSSGGNNNEVRSSTAGNNTINVSVGGSPRALTHVNTSAWQGDVGRLEIKKQGGYQALAYTNIIVLGTGSGPTIAPTTATPAGMTPAPTPAPTAVPPTSGPTVAPGTSTIIDFEDLRPAIAAYYTANGSMARLPKINEIAPNYKGIIWPENLHLSVNEYSNVLGGSGNLSYYTASGAKVYAILSGHGDNNGPYGGSNQSLPMSAEIIFPVGTAIKGMSMLGSGGNNIGVTSSNNPMIYINLYHNMNVTPADFAQWTYPAGTVVITKPGGYNAVTFTDIEVTGIVGGATAAPTVVPPTATPVGITSAPKPTASAVPSPKPTSGPVILPGDSVFIDFEDLRPAITEYYLANGSSARLPKINQLVPPTGNGVGYMGIIWPNNLHLSVNYMPYPVGNINGGDASYSFYTETGNAVYAVLSGHTGNNGPYGDPNNDHNAAMSALITFPDGMVLKSMDMSGSGGTNIAVVSSNNASVNIGLAHNQVITPASFSQWQYPAGTVTVNKPAGFNSVVFTNIEIAGSAIAGAPVIMTASLPNGTMGTAYSATLTAVGTAPFTWSVSSGKLPQGLSLNAQSGVISGTPYASGTFTFEIQASNGDGSGNKQFVVNIVKASAGTVIIDFEDLRPAIQAHLAFTLPLNDNTNPYLYNRKLPNIRQLTDASNYKGISWPNGGSINWNGITLRFEWPYDRHDGAWPGDGSNGTTYHHPNGYDYGSFPRMGLENALRPGHYDLDWEHDLYLTINDFYIGGVANEFISDYKADGEKVYAVMSGNPNQDHGTHNTGGPYPGPYTWAYDTGPVACKITFPSGAALVSMYLKGNGLKLHDSDNPNPEYRGPFFRGNPHHNGVVTFSSSTQGNEPFDVYCGHNGVVQKVNFGDYWDYESGTVSIARGPSYNVVAFTDIEVDFGVSAMGSPDINCDGQVDGSDLAILLDCYGQTGGFAADLDGGGQVDSADLSVLLDNYGK